MVKQGKNLHYSAVKGLSYRHYRGTKLNQSQNAKLPAQVTDIKHTFIKLEKLKTSQEFMSQVQPAVNQ